MFKFLQNSIVPGEVVNDPIKPKLLELINGAKSQIQIIAFIFNLSNTEEGKEIFDALQNAVNRGVKIEVIIDKMTERVNHMSDLIELKKNANFSYTLISMKNYFQAGVCHLKLFIVDRKIVVSGSANMLGNSYDSKTVDEVSLITDDADIVDRCCGIYDFWNLFIQKQPKDEIKSYLDTQTGMTLYQPILTNETKSLVQKYLVPKVNDKTKDGCMFFSPRALENIGYNTEREEILNVIKNAKSFINLTAFEFDQNMRHYGNYIDPDLYTELIKAAVNRKVKIKILVGGRADVCFTGVIDAYLNLKETINALLMRNPSYYEHLCEIRFSNNIPKKYLQEKQRPEQHIYVLHSKYILTDQTCYFTTSNFTPDYYYTSVNIGFKFYSESILSFFLKHFNVRWNHNPIVI